MRPTNFQGNIHIINFPPSTSAAELAELFDDFGLVLGAHIKSIPSTGGHLRLGIVSLAPDKVADKAIEALQGYQLGGQKLKLKRAKPPVKGEKKQGARRPTERPMQSSAELFPARMPSEPPRKVIVEYRGRRALNRATTL
ncbi:MAG: RNA-binding protein [Rhodospirillales bacterium]|nr:RNA-binding protein [Rhodospirillales bacterium]